MSAYELAVIVAGLFMLVAIHQFHQTSCVCVECGGRGGHRRDCPTQKDKS
jgi:hypothetical protein